MENKKVHIRIKKVKFSKSADKIIMEYERLVGDQWDKYSFESGQQAAPELYGAFEALAEHVAVLCELPNDYIKRLDVYGANYRYSGEDEVMGATMTAKMGLNFSKTPLVLNTPFKKSGPDNSEEFDDTQYLTEGCVKALWELERQARLFIDGKRAQISLFAEDAQGACVQNEAADELVDDFSDNDDGAEVANVINFPVAQQPATSATI